MWRLHQLWPICIRLRVLSEPDPLQKKRPEYFRRLPTPIAEQAAKETVYIAQNIFLGRDDDMEDIAAAVRKVERHCVESGSHGGDRKPARTLQLPAASMRQRI